MIYLDSAATSLLKPPAVAAATADAIRRCASPGRGSHAAAMLAAETAFACREAAAALFHISEPERVVFTQNATHGLNIAIRSCVRPGSRVALSGLEHNAVLRPLAAAGAELLWARTPLFDRDAALAEFRRLIPRADAVVCTHVSNVFGCVLPVAEIAALCRERQIPFILDAAQSAGALPLDAAALGAAFIAMPGHKGLLGPQGTGLLLCGGDAEPLLYGGTGSRSADVTMPDYLPDRLEAGTQNICGVAGLRQGIEHIRRRGVADIQKREARLLRRLAAELGKIPGLRLFLSKDASQQCAVLSVQADRLPCETLAEELGRRGVAVRSGLHCAPAAHRSAGTFDLGTVRFSLSPFNTEREIGRAAEITENILKNSNKL